MPTYEYRCLKCKKKFEQLQSMSEPALKKCIHCRGKVERLIGSGAGLIFKGSGFYITDYKKKSTPSEKSKPTTETPSAKEHGGSLPVRQPGASGGKKEP